MRFCPSCGARLKQAPTRACPSCGAILAAGRAAEPVPVHVTAVKTLVESFPFKGMRPHQREVLGQIESALKSGKKFIILEAPVGFGKSAVAAALARHLRSAYVLTSTKQLQDQYSRDFGFSTVMGKSNFTCYVPTSNGRHVDCARGRCQADWSLTDCPHYLTFQQYELHLKHFCDKESKCEKVMKGDDKLCVYYKQKWDSFRKDVTVGNYSFFFSELRFTDDLKKRKLLVCDEAHELEKQLVGSSAYTLRSSSIRQFHAPGMPEFVAELREGMEADASAWLGALVAARDSLKGYFEAHDGDATLQEKLIVCRSMRDSLDEFIDELKATPQNWIVSNVRRTETIGGFPTVDEATFQPLDVAAHTSKLFGTADTVLLMSATIFSAEQLCNVLGIPREKAEFVKVADSSFPVENRRIYAMDVARLSRATMDASLESVAKAVDEIMDRYPADRGVIHTTTYQQVNYIMQHVSEHNRSRLVTTEGNKSRSQLLQTHGATGGSVLISPSLYLGVDLKDDLARFQIIVKVPFPDISDKRTKVKMENNRSWYDWQTALRLVQTYGRGVRSETDSCVTFVLDSNFLGFLNTHREIFPGYFIEAVSPI